MPDKHIFMREVGCHGFSPLIASIFYYVAVFSLVNLLVLSFCIHSVVYVSGLFSSCSDSSAPASVSSALFLYASLVLQATCTGL